MNKKTGLRLIVTLCLLAISSLALLGGAGGASAYPSGDATTLSITDPTLCSQDGANAVGTNFQPGETVTFSFQGAAVASAVVDETGGFALTYQLPDNLEAGDYPVTAIGNLTNMLASASVNIASSGCPLTEAEAARLAAEQAAAAAALAASQKSDGLAFTGFQAASVGVVGLILIGGGLLLTIASRRRRDRGHHGIDS